MKLKVRLNEDEIFSYLKKHLFNSYAKYSNFYVCCILETKTNDAYKYYFGNNVENASFGLTICAERNAICNFYSNKDADETILNLYLLASNISKTYKDIIFPCGACLQFIQEFFKENNNIICYSINKDKSVFRINDLLPNAFLLNKKKETK